MKIGNNIFTKNLLYKWFSSLYIHYSTSFFYFLVHQVKCGYFLFIFDKIFKLIFNMNRKLPLRNSMYFFDVVHKDFGNFSNGRSNSYICTCVIVSRKESIQCFDAGNIFDFIEQKCNVFSIDKFHFTTLQSTRYYTNMFCLLYRQHIATSQSLLFGNVAKRARVRKLWYFGKSWNLTNLHSYYKETNLSHNTHLVSFFSTFLAYINLMVIRLRIEPIRLDLRFKVI